MSNKTRGKYISDLPLLENVTSNTTIVVEEEGSAKRLPSNIFATRSDLTFLEDIISDQILAALANLKVMTPEEIDAICGVDDVTALVRAEFLFEAIDSEGNIFIDSYENSYVF